MTALGHPLLCGIMEDRFVLQAAVQLRYPLSTGRDGIYIPDFCAYKCALPIHARAPEIPVHLAQYTLQVLLHFYIQSIPATAMSTGCRRGKAMPTDSPAAKFLYTIIKQLDLKSVSLMPDRPPKLTHTN